MEEVSTPPRRQLKRQLSFAGFENELSPDKSRDISKRDASTALLAATTKSSSKMASVVPVGECVAEVAAKKPTEVPFLTTHLGMSVGTHGSLAESKTRLHTLAAALSREAAEIEKHRQTMDSDIWYTWRSSWKSRNDECKQQWRRLKGHDHDSDSVSIAQASTCFAGAPPDTVCPPPSQAFTKEWRANKLRRKEKTGMPSVTLEPCHPSSCVSVPSLKGSVQAPLPLRSSLLLVNADASGRGPH